MSWSYLPNISSKIVQLFGQSICKIKHIHQNKRMYLQISKYLLHKSNPKSALPNKENLYTIENFSEASWVVDSYKYQPFT